MATHYRLTCPAGHEMAVEAGQAGDHIRCECGAAVTVPKLGELRLLPRIESAGRVQPESNWSARHGLITIGGLIAVVSLLLGVYFWAVTPSSSDYDTSDQVAQAAAHVDSLTPAETWTYWHNWTVPIARAGLHGSTTAQAVEFDREVGKGTTYQKLAFGTAGFAVLFCIVVALLGPAARKGKR